jgi:hypothetical protein
MRRVPVISALLLATVVLAVGAPAFAHTASRSAAPVLPTPSLHEVLTAAPAGPALPWTAIALLAAVALAGVSRKRRVVAITLVLVVGLLAFETGVHSAHHLGKADEAAHCTVAWMSSQLSADTVGTIVHALPVPVPEVSAPALASPALAERTIAPDAGRAPPVLSV